MRYQELKKDRVTCLIPAEHPFAVKSSVSLEDMKDCTVIACSPLDAPLSIAAFQEKILERHNPDKIRYCSSIEAAHCLVGAGIGIALLPGMLCLKAPEYACVPVAESGELSFGMFCHERERSLQLNSFIRQLSGNADKVLENKPDWRTTQRTGDTGNPKTDMVQ